MKFVSAKFDFHRASNYIFSIKQSVLAKCAKEVIIFGHKNS